MKAFAVAVGCSASAASAAPIRTLRRGLHACPPGACEPTDLHRVSWLRYIRRPVDRANKVRMAVVR